MRCFGDSSAGSRATTDPLSLLTRNNSPAPFAALGLSTLSGGRQQRLSAPPFRLPIKLGDHLIRMFDLARRSSRRYDSGGRISKQSPDLRRGPDLSRDFLEALGRCAGSDRKHPDYIIGIARPHYGVFPFARGRRVGRLFQLIDQSFREINLFRRPPRDDSPSRTVSKHSPDVSD